MQFFHVFLKIIFLSENGTCEAQVGFQYINGLERGARELTGGKGCTIGPSLIPVFSMQELAI